MNMNNCRLTRYILPSVISMLIVGTYTNIDGLFIGNIVGDDGLAAINLAWPIVAFITSVGMGIGIGGCVMLNNYSGRGEPEKKEEVKKAILYLLAAAGLFTGIIMYFVYKPFLQIMGADGNVMEYASQYSGIISIGAVFQVMGAGLVALLRNENKTVFAMFCTITGLIVHIAVAMIFVGEYKLAAVAAATVISQASVMIMCFAAIRVKRKSRVGIKTAAEVLKASASPFGLNFVPSVVLLLTNYFAIKTGGVAAVSAYAVMSYAVYTFEYVFQGICDGVQPVLSFYNGAYDYQGRRTAVLKSNILLGICSLLFMVSTPVLIKYMPKIFSASDEAGKMIQSGFWFYAAAYPLKAAVKSICSYSYACKRFTMANILIYAEPAFAAPICLFTLTKWLGTDGLWAAFTMSQAVILLIALVSYIISRRKNLKLKV